MKRTAATACMVLVAALSPPRAHAAALDPADFLATRLCADGSLPLVDNCSAARRQTASDTMRWRRHDWPAPSGYQIADSYIGTGGAAQLTWSYAPFGPFVAANGDGGEVYAVGRDGAVTIAQTQDGGKAGIQYFVGARCGGTGWLAFKADAPSGRWAQQIATLSDAPDPRRCPGLGQAFTRWRLEDVPIPFVIRGQRRSVTVRTIISEHYDGPSIARSRHLERSLFGEGWGRLVWEAWGFDPPTVDLSQRCGTTPYSTAPARGWQLEDCRYSTNLQPADGAMTGAKFAWPPR